MKAPLTASIEIARKLWRDQAKPSAIYRAMVHRGHGPPELTEIFREAFDVSLADTNGEAHIDTKTWEPRPTFDAWLLPLIQAKRPR